MRCVTVAAFAILVLACSATSMAPEPMYRRGSSSSGGSPEPHSSGLLGDIVSQGRKRPASSSQVGQTEHHHPSQDHSVHHPVQGHLMQGHPMQGHPLETHLMQGHPTEGQPMQGHPTQPQSSSLEVMKTPRLIRLAVTLDPSAKPSREPKGQSGGRRGGRRTPQPEDGRPRRKPSAPKEPEKQRKPRKAQEAWWKKPGGVPHRAQGSSPDFDKNRSIRDMKKLKSLLRSPPDLDEHPSGPHHHQGPHGGPPSPGAGSHAVSKRRHWKD